MQLHQQVGGFYHHRNVAVRFAHYTDHFGAVVQFYRIVFIVAQVFLIAFYAVRRYENYIVQRCVNIKKILYKPLHYGLLILRSKHFLE